MSESDAAFHRTCEDSDMGGRTALMEWRANTGEDSGSSLVADGLSASGRLRRDNPREDLNDMADNGSSLVEDSGTPSMFISGVTASASLL